MVLFNAEQLMFCGVCGSADSESADSGTFLKCDNGGSKCQYKEHGGHFGCYGLKSVPKGDWFCGHCETCGA